MRKLREERVLLLGNIYVHPWSTRWHLVAMPHSEPEIFPEAMFNQFAVWCNRRCCRLGVTQGQGFAAFFGASLVLFVEGQPSTLPVSE